MTAILLGIFLGACLFAATLSSVARALTTTGRRRAAHLAILAAILGAAAAVSLGWTALSLPLGLALIAAGLAGAALESGAHRVLPIVPVLFGAALLAGLPFAS